MLAAGGGAIVNNASVAGLVGFAGIPAYAASKHGVVGLTKTAAMKYTTAGVHVNAVCPGVIDTDMISRFTGGTRRHSSSSRRTKPSAGSAHRRDRGGRGVAVFGRCVLRYRSGTRGRRGLRRPMRAL